ncbi:MAG TPA: twin-arginine translocation signal domain-containing protein [Candidatus Binatia bacterium]|nr:twin-arginine translocation signal domain-containing protein [Candidatus Binatia bacterium]
MSINLEISRRQFLKTAAALVIAPLSDALELK